MRLTDSRSSRDLKLVHIMFRYPDCVNIQIALY